jgi:hypothetical protein
MRRTAIVVSALVLLASACSLGPREDWAEAIRGAFEDARVNSTMSVKQTVSVKVIETTIRQTPGPLVARSQGVADFKSRRAEMIETAKRKAHAVYDDLVVYLSRSKSSVGTTGKRWAAFNFEREPSVDLDDNDRRLAIGAGVISPVLAVEMLDGILTGSVKEIGTGMKAGVSTTRYNAHLAPDAVVTEIKDEDRKEGVERLFATLGVQQDDFPVDVWLDADDHIRGVRYVMRQQKDRVNAFEMTVSYEFLDDPKGAEAIEIPARDDTVRPGRFRDFVTELIREFT